MAEARTYNQRRRSGQNSPEEVRRPVRRRYALWEQLDLSLILNLLIIMGFGLLMVYSASSYSALRMFSEQAHFFKRQLLWDVVGLVLGLVVVFVPYGIYKKFALVIYLISLASIFLVIPFGNESHGASRWVVIPGTKLQFQPSEIVKIAIILFVAFMINRLGESVNTLQGMALVFVPTLPAMALIFGLTSHLSSALIVLGITIMMLFISCRDYKFFLGVFILLGLIAAGVCAYVASSDLSEGNYRFGRIVAWLYPELSTDETAHQILNSLYAIGNGGFWGKGLGQSVQKISALPEPHNDFIFAIICEELGAFGAIVLVLLYVLLLFQMYRVARRTKDRFGFLLVVGVMAHIAIQVVLHIAVNTNSMPNTGVSLPFVSYGGSSAVLLIVEMGLVLSVQRQNVISESDYETK
ncbi:MAG: FtsW/RodA/SpoVE family cell cycle protein [Lachnospiraceae bacterium]|nr:FtsW/RodA/SpoVE family cell cycle protein [Lachnospiraceae bacterium]